MKALLLITMAVMVAAKLDMMAATTAVAVWIAAFAVTDTTAARRRGARAGLVVRLMVFVPIGAALLNWAVWKP